MADYNKFLQDLSFQMNLAGMDGPSRTRLAKLKSDKTTTKDQATWDPEASPPDPVDAAYSIVADADWAALYLMFQKVLRDMDLNRADIVEKTPDVEDFLTSVYATTGAPVAAFQVTNTVTAIIDPLVTGTSPLVDYLNNPNVGIFLQTNGINADDRKNLRNKLASGDYKKNPKALRTLQELCAILVNNEADLIAAGLNFNTFVSPAQLVDVYNNADTPEPPNTTELDAFKTGYQSIVKTLVTKEKIRTAFAENDSDRKITRAIAKGLEKSNYREGTNQLTPLYADRKRLFESAKSKVTGFVDDHLGKFQKRHKRHLYSTNAKFIVGEIIKNKINPTDGMAKVLENADKIKEALQTSAPKAAADFDYMTSILKKLSKTKAFSESLKDGDQLRYIVQEIIKDAIHNGKKDAAKATLETLAMMRYGATTSSIRGELKKANWTFFGDKSLSWNKFEGLQFLSNATDKTIKAFSFAVFETANFAKNKLIRQKGVKFKNGTTRIKEAQKSPGYSDPAKRAEMEELFAFWDFVNSGNTSDFNPFRSHKSAQKDWEGNNPATGNPVMLDNFNDYYALNPIGR